ncbi:MAG: AmmeMemoRadiSam system protein B [Sedimentisphaerales bacterium]|nr:AmmeMemoRadiSam system protein B [Sedimentisphaerales bacterium]
MSVRRPIVAGQFYPATEKQCRAEIEACLAARPLGGIQLPGKIAAGIVPHAGWTFSGDLAGMVFSAIKKVEGEIDTFVIFGAVHSHFGTTVAVYDTGSWFTPMGEIKIDEELAKAICEKSSAAKSNPDAHMYEHSIEVQIPFIQHLFEGAKIVPAMTPPAECVLEFGSDVAECIKGFPDKKIACIASTDLTHYGPRYGFDPKGKGEAGIKWAKDINDKAFIDLAIEMQAEKILNDSLVNQNACGPGAAAAAIATAKELGKSKGVLLAHTHSNEVMEKKYGQSSSESVGYTAIVY